MRWSEIQEALVHAQPLRAASGKMKKAVGIIPVSPPPMDPGTALAMAVPQIAQAVAGGSQAAAQQAVAIDDAQEAQATKQAQIQKLRQQAAS